MNQKPPDFPTHCTNPDCLEPHNPIDAVFCYRCGSRLLLGDRYRAVQLLGQGGSGKTFLAIDQQQPSLTWCVVKQLRYAGLYDYLTTLRFQNYVHQFSQLGDHPQISKLLDHLEQEHHFYLIQEYISGENLATILVQYGRLNAAKTWHLLETVLPVLQFMHTHSVVHGDLKPENIILTRHVDLAQSEILSPYTEPALIHTNLKQLDSYTPVVVGLTAVNVAVAAGMTLSAMGSPEYAAPEQIRGTPTFASDLYSLGVTCIHLLTGIRPFHLFDIANHQWTWRSYWLPEPANSQQQLDNEQLASLLDRLIQPDLHERFCSATEAIATLQSLRRKKRSLFPAVPMQPVVPMPKAAWKCHATLTGHDGLFANINALAIAPNSTTLASASDDKTIRVWDVHTSASLMVLRSHTQFVKSVAFHPHDCTRLISSSRDRTIKIWDLQTQHDIQTLMGHEQMVNVALFSPDGSAIASGSADKTVKLWHSQTGELITSLSGHTLSVTALAFSPPTSDYPPILVSTSVDATIKVWNLATLNLMCTLTGHTAAIKAVAFSPDGTLLATGGEDRTIRLWHLPSQHCIRIFPGHSWAVSALLFAAHGETLISGSWDKTVKLWHVSTGEEAAVLMDHTDSVSCVAIAPDQSIIASGSYDKTIKLWINGTEISKN